MSKKWNREMAPGFDVQIKAAEKTPIFKHISLEEVKDLLDRYELGEQGLSLQIAANIGFMRGVQAERERRKAKKLPNNSVDYPDTYYRGYNEELFRELEGRDVIIYDEHHGTSVRLRKATAAAIEHFVDGYSTIIVL